MQSARASDGGAGVYLGGLLRFVSLGDITGDGLDVLLLGDQYTPGPIENWTNYPDDW